jgi:nitrite reductase/ring-hydroxylating ferredoxin subunit
VVIGLHLLVYRKESAIDRAKAGAERDGFVRACRADAVIESRGKVARIGGGRIAIFRHQNKIFAMSNVCRHQGGPIGEGRIVDGCVTCPWHGWQYKPDDGCSPPPFAEIVPTYRVQIVDGDVYVHPTPNPLRTACPGVLDAATTAPNGSPEFYVGYLKRVPSGIARFTRTAASALALFVPVATAIMAAAQSPVDRGEYEFGVSRRFTGTLFEQPLPLLRVSSAGGGTLSFPLVGPGKSGLPAFAHGHSGQKVEFRGSLIIRDGLTMIEVNDEASFHTVDGAVATPAPSRVESLGRVKLAGELVDTKCYFGVMRPAVGKVHRACAVRCLDGGVPPGLLLRLPDGSSQVVMLAGLEGKPLQFDPQWAALTVTAEGPFELHDGIPVLRTAGIEAQR